MFELFFIMAFIFLAFRLSPYDIITWSWTRINAYEKLRKRGIGYWKARCLSTDHERRIYLYISGCGVGAEHYQEHLAWQETLAKAGLA